jgi:hypothetical protein
MHNSAKTSYGYPLFVRANLTKSLYEIYLDLFEIVGINEEVRNHIEQFIVESSQKFE